jgi:hypothetical protein
MPKRITYEREMLHPETGELQVTHRDSVLPKEPDYVKLYLSDIELLNNLPKWTDRILHELLRMMNYKNQIVLNSSIKKEIAAEFKIHIKTIDNALVMLVKQGVLIRKDKGLYLGNPLLFGKGEWKDIRELRLTIHYTKEGRTMTAEILQEQEELELVEV